jgi:hypothetical protein
MSTGAVCETGRRGPDRRDTLAACQNETPREVPKRPDAETSLAHMTSGVLEDVVLLLFVILLLPVAILVVGTPVALCVRFVVAIVRRL